MGNKKNPVYDTAYQLYLDGLSLEQVAKEIGVTRQCVFKAFKKRNFILRGVNFQPHQFYDGKKFSLRSSGYYSLTTNNRYLMHRYIWEKEKGKIPAGWDIHHIDENKANNSISNLKCLPKPEHTRKYSPSNNQFGKGKRRLVKILHDGSEEIFPHASETSKILGITAGALRLCASGKSKTCLGYKWRYESN
jgi:hypothetical protein